MTNPPFSVTPDQCWLNTSTTPPQAMKRNANNAAWEPTRLNEWRIEITNCAGTPMEIKLAAPESLSAQGVLVKLGAALDYSLEVLAERMFGVPRGLGIMFTREVPIELFQKTRYKIEARMLSGRDWSSLNTVGDLRFTTKAEAEEFCAKEYPYLWDQKDLRVVIAND